MYLLEKDAHDTKISTFADSLWWGVVSIENFEKNPSNFIQIIKN